MLGYCKFVILKFMDGNSFVPAVGIFGLLTFRRVVPLFMPGFGVDKQVISSNSLMLTSSGLSVVGNNPYPK